MKELLLQAASKLDPFTQSQLTQLSRQSPAERFEALLELAEKSTQKQIWRELLDLGLNATTDSSRARKSYQTSWWRCILDQRKLHSGEALIDVHSGLLDNEAVILELAKKRGKEEASILVLHSIRGAECCLHCKALLEGLTDITTWWKGEEVMLVHGTCSEHAARGDYLPVLRERIKKDLDLELEELIEEALKEGERE